MPWAPAVESTQAQLHFNDCLRFLSLGRLQCLTAELKPVISSSPLRVATLLPIATDFALILAPGSF